MNYFYEEGGLGGKPGPPSSFESDLRSDSNEEPDQTFFKIFVIPADIGLSLPHYYFVSTKQSNYEYH